MPSVDRQLFPQTAAEGGNQTAGGPAEVEAHDHRLRLPVVEHEGLYIERIVHDRLRLVGGNVHRRHPRPQRARLGVGGQDGGDQEARGH